MNSNTTVSNRSRKEFPCPNGCGRHFATRAGLASHGRGSTCKSIEQEPTPVASISGRLPLQPITEYPNMSTQQPTFRPSRELSPNLLFMSATQGNLLPRDDDDYSIISEQLEDYEIPEDILEAEKYTPRREDGRNTGIISFVADIVEARAPLGRPSIGSIVLNTGQFSLVILDLLIKSIIIYLAYMAIYFCRNGECSPIARDTHFEDASWSIREFKTINRTHNVYSGASD